MDEPGISPSSPQELRDRINKIGQTWEQLLYGSGGLLSALKTYWYLLFWVWENGKAQLATASELPIDLTLKIGQNQHNSTITRKDPDKAIRQLGVLTSPAGSFKAEAQQRV
eukprot:436232-Ditylum_brightwellii.AAC.1